MGKLAHLPIGGTLLLVFLFPDGVFEKEVVEGHDVVRVVAVARVVLDPSFVEVLVCL